MIQSTPWLPTLTNPHRLRVSGTPTPRRCKHRTHTLSWRNHTSSDSRDSLTESTPRPPSDKITRPPNTKDPYPMVKLKPHVFYMSSPPSLLTWPPYTLLRRHRTGIPHSISSSSRVPTVRWSTRNTSPLFRSPYLPTYLGVRTSSWVRSSSRPRFYHVVSSSCPVTPPHTRVVTEKETLIKSQT